MSQIGSSSQLLGKEKCIKMFQTTNQYIYIWLAWSTLVLFEEFGRVAEWLGWKFPPLRVQSKDVPNHQPDQVDIPMDVPIDDPWGTTRAARAACTPRSPNYCRRAPTRSAERRFAWASRCWHFWGIFFGGKILGISWDFTRIWVLMGILCGF